MKPSLVALVALSVFWMSSPALSLDYTVSVVSDGNAYADWIVPENEVVPFQFTVQNGDRELLNVAQVIVQFPTNYAGRKALAPNGWAAQGSAPWNNRNDLNFVALGDSDLLVSGQSRTFEVHVSVPSADVQSVSFSSSDKNVGRTAIVWIRLFSVSAPETPQSQTDSDDDGLSDYQESVDGTNHVDPKSNAYRLIVQGDTVAVDRAIRFFLYHPTIGKMDANAIITSPSGRGFNVSANDEKSFVFSPSEEGAYQVVVQRNKAQKTAVFKAYGVEVVPGGAVGESGTAGAQPPELPVDFVALVAVALAVEVFGFTLSKVFFPIPSNALHRARQLLMRLSLAMLLFSLPVGLAFAANTGFQNAVVVAFIELVLLFMAVYYKTRISGFHIVYLFTHMLFREGSIHPSAESVADQSLEFELSRRKVEPTESERDLIMKDIMSRLEQAMASNETKAKAKTTDSIQEVLPAPLWNPSASLGVEKKSLNRVRYFESKEPETGKNNALLSLVDQLGAPASASQATLDVDGKPSSEWEKSGWNGMAFHSEKSALLEVRVPGYCLFREKMVPFKNGALHWTIELQSAVQLTVLDEQNRPLNQAFVSIRGESEPRLSDVGGNFIWQTIQGQAIIPLRASEIKSKRLTIKCIQAHFEESSDSFGKEQLAEEKQFKKTIHLKKIG